MPLPRLIPCLDVADGRVVKGVKFLGLRDVGDPVELGAAYSDAGADELVFLDVRATLDGPRHARRLVERVAERLAIPFTVGGGVRTRRRRARRSSRPGADKVGGQLRGARAARARSPSSPRGSARRRSSSRSTRAAARCVSRAGTSRPARDAVAWAREAAGARRGRDPAHLDRRRRHARGLRPRAHRARSPTRCRSR